MKPDIGVTFASSALAMKLASVNFCTERGTRLFPRFHHNFSWQFHWLVGYATAAVQPGSI